MNCQFTIDNSAFEVSYNGRTLNISGDVHNWKEMKNFSFVSDQESEKQELMVKGGDWDVSGHCKLAGRKISEQMKWKRVARGITSHPTLFIGEMKPRIQSFALTTSQKNTQQTQPSKLCLVLEQ